MNWHPSIWCLLVVLVGSISCQEETLDSPLESVYGRQWSPPKYLLRNWYPSETDDDDEYEFIPFESRDENDRPPNSLEEYDRDDQARYQVDKKQTDWSKYVGLDRRRKKAVKRQFLDMRGVNRVDHEWQHRKNRKEDDEDCDDDDKDDDNDIPPNGEFINDKRKRVRYSASPEESKLENINLKLKKIEDMIIDEALLYTGAHEDEEDPKEIQEVKDKVIGRLAAAYSLEKIRNAINDYRKNVGPQMRKLKDNEKLDYLNNEADNESIPVIKKSLKRAAKRDGRNDDKKKKRSPSAQGHEHGGDNEESAMSRYKKKVMADLGFGEEIDKKNGM